MSNLIEMFQQQLSGGLLQQIGQQAGIEDPQAAETSANAIFTTLMGAMARNASTPEGANALSSALERDHDGSILDDAMGFLTGNRQPANTNALNGSGILGHILGGKQSGVVDLLSRVTGQNSGSLMKMMVMLAPVVMGVLGKSRAQQNVGSSGIGDLIGSVLGGGGGGMMQQAGGGGALMSILNSVLDKDNDGNFLDDLLGGGSAPQQNRQAPPSAGGFGDLLGGLFGKK